MLSEFSNQNSSIWLNESDDQAQLENTVFVYFMNPIYYFVFILLGDYKVMYQ